PGKNPVVSACVGAGKSILIAKFCEGIIQSYPHVRIINLVHTKELIEQNAAKFSQLASSISSSVYSASIGEKSVSGQVVYGGIQSIWKSPHLCRFDIAIVDEAHLISKQAEKGMYRQYLDELKRLNPNLVIIAFTGTPYRMSGGSLVEGDDRLFDEIAYDISIRQLLDKGFLSPLVLPDQKVQTKFDTSNVKTTGNDFNQKALTEVMDDLYLIKEAVSEYMILSRGRKCHLIFGSSIEHCYHLKDVFSQYMPCDVVHGGLKKKEREQLISAHKNNEIPMLINQGVLTTGYDCPQIDSIGLFRATKSVPLYIQIAGRGLRLAEGKKDCLWVDFTDTTERLGPVDDVIPPPTKFSNAKGQAPIKKCFSCEELIPAQAQSCPRCGVEFEMVTSPNHNTTASTASILREVKEPLWADVKSITARNYLSRKSGKRTLRINYHCGIMTHSEWKTVEGNDYMRGEFNKWWIRVTGGNLAPIDIDNSVDRIGELKINRVLVDENGKYPKI
ncbi:MAG: helicase-related protein, partial [Glaciecola sp.]